MKECHISYDSTLQRLQIVLHNDMTSDELFQLFHISRKHRYQYYVEKRVQVQGNIITQNTPCKRDDKITLLLITEPSSIPVWNHPIDIIYEDELCLILNKPVSMIVHSDGQNTTHTLNNCVQAYYNKQGLSIPVRAIHRLDQETSGLIFYCKIPFFQPYFDHELEKKRIERIYLAWVCGDMKQAITVEQPIARDRHDAKKMRVSATGAYACTTFQPLQHKKAATLVECHLKTGRTHQVRVHLAYLHHPIIGDRLYGTKDSRIARCALHAYKLRFVHPIKDKSIEVVCEMKDDMKYF